ncbi:hypothetical protein ACOMHN_063425 [Nucella lapillus]
MPDSSRRRNTFSIRRNTSSSSSVAVLHGTMKRELRHQVSKKVLRHKLHKLQDYSLVFPDKFTPIAEFNDTMLQFKKCGKESKVDESADRQRERDMHQSLKNMFVTTQIDPDLEVTKLTVSSAAEDLSKKVEQLLSLSEKDMAKVNQDEDLEKEASEAACMASP